MSNLPRFLRPAAITLAALGGLTAGTLLWTPVSGAAENGSLADLIERVRPSVVTILATHGGTVNARGMPEGMAPDPRDLFRRFGIPGMPGMGPDAAPESNVGLGSGFVYDAAGYIVTNNHVVAEAEKVRVRFPDDLEYDATVIGTDPQTDLALIKVDVAGLSPLTLGDSDRMRVGDDVVAVGNPFGLNGTVTRGIISAKGRDIKAGPYVDFLQTDAAINRGNSGGPLFNLEGEVIGVNAAIFSPSGGSVGVGFAIPSNTVKQVVADLMTSGKVDRGWLGVSIQAVTPEIAAALRLPEAHGALVAGVASDSPAEGRLKVGDVILSFDGTKLKDSRDLPRVVGLTPAGKTVEVAVLRGGSTETVKVRVGALKVEQATLASRTSRPGETPSERLGATLSSLNRDTREALGLDAATRGAVVTSLRPDGAAAEAGLQVGDVILQVGNAEVTSPADVAKALQFVRKGSALLLVMRDGEQLFVGVPMQG